MLDTIAKRPPDPLLKVMKAFRDDPRVEKIDLGVGVYRDENGKTPLMAAIKEAMQRLAAEQTTKVYVGQQGDVEFLNLLGELAFGPIARELASIQAVGGTGALRLGFDLLKASGAKRVLLPTPSWPNHPALIAAAGLERIDVPFFNVSEQRIDLDALIAGFAQAEPGDAVLLQGCCHNPLGADFTQAQWAKLTEALAARQLVAFVDVAYIGFGDGIEEDVTGVRHVLERTPNVIVSVSGAKSFGVYRERVGALYVKAAAQARDAVMSNLFAIARANYSMPPDHGAACVRTVLADETLRANWRAELDAIRGHIKRTREALAAARINSMPMHLIAAQKGMFSTLPLSPEQITTLRQQYGIYMTDSGRINVAGLRAQDLPRFLDALKAVA
ncbi:MAG: aromatic amino acid transaminase [Hyphomonadaceae bacterium]